MKIKLLTLPLIENQQCGYCGTTLNIERDYPRNVIGLQTDQAGLPKMMVRCKCGKPVEWETTTI